MDNQILNFLEKNEKECPLLIHLRGHEISVASDSQISYFEEVVTAKGKSIKKKTSKISAYLINILKEKGVEYSNQDIENIALLYKATFMEQSIFLTTNVLSTYLPRNQSSGGTLANSCMNKDSLVGRMKFYEKNGVKSICILADDKKTIIARALFWENVLLYNENNEYVGVFNYVDRIYCNDDKNAVFIRMFAKNRNWVYHKPNGEGHGAGVPNHHKYGDNLRVLYKLPNINNDKLPYMDTFCMIDPLSGYCSNNIDLMTMMTGKTKFLRAHSTSGTPDIIENNNNDFCKLYINRINNDVRENIDVPAPNFDIID